MNAKSIYDKLVNVEGIPSSILTYSDKNDCIIIEVQDYDKSVFKFAQKFFNGYKSVDIDYTNENKTSVWYNDVSEYSDRETIDSITRFYYGMKVKGLVESKKSARKSMKEFNEDINNTAYFDRVAGELHSWYVCYVEDYERKYEYGFKNEKECINWIKKNGFDLDPSMIESKKSARKSIKESRGQTVAELLQNASSKTIVHIYNDSTSDEFVGTNDQLKGEFSRFLYYTVSVWNISNDKIVNIYCY